MQSGRDVNLLTAERVLYYSIITTSEKTPDFMAKCVFAPKHASRYYLKALIYIFPIHFGL